MKNLKSKFEKSVRFLLVIGLTVFGLQACQEKANPETNRISEDAIEQMKKDHLIALNDAVKMYDKYDKLRIKFFKDSLKKKYGNDFKDTRTIWFDLASVKAYIQYIEDNAADAEGLAFYFGVNASNARQGKNHQSFFIAPTVKNGDKQSGFTVKNGKRVFLYEAFKDAGLSENMQQGSFFRLVQDDDGYLFNFGTGSPPGGNN